MAKRLTQKMEKFCVLLFETGDPRQSAIGAGYSEKSASTIASLNRDKPVIQRRLEALNKMAEESSRSTRLEREQRLTVFEREDILNEKGILIRTSNISAISEHNKMDGIYSPEIRNINDIKIMVVYDDRDKGNNSTSTATPRITAEVHQEQSEEKDS